MPESPFGPDLPPQLVAAAEKDPSILEYLKAFGAGGLKSFLGDSYETLNDAAAVAPETAAGGQLMGYGLGAGAAAGGLKALLAKAGMAGKAALATAAGGGGYALSASEAEARSKRRKGGGEKKVASSISDEGGAPTGQPQEQTQGFDDGKLKFYQIAAQHDPKVAIILKDYTNQAAIVDYETHGRGGYGPRAESARKKLDEIQGKLDESVKAYLPFDQAHPQLSASLPMLGFAAPFAGGMVARTTGRAFANAPVKAMNRATRQAEKAIEGGHLSGPNPGRAERKVTEVENYLKSPPKGPGAGTDYAMPALMGGSLGAELSLIPDQFNRRNALPGTPEHDSAEAKFADPMATLKTAAVPVLMGVLSGSAAGKMPGRVARPEVERARAVVTNVRGKDGKGRGVNAVTSDIGDQMTVDAMKRQKSGQGGGQGGFGGVNWRDALAASKQASASRNALHQGVSTGGHQAVNQAVQAITSKGGQVTPNALMAHLRPIYKDGRIDGVKINRREMTKVIKKLREGGLAR